MRLYSRGQSETDLLLEAHLSGIDWGNFVRDTFVHIHLAGIDHSVDH